MFCQPWGRSSSSSDEDEDDDDRNDNDDLSSINDSNISSKMIFVEDTSATTAEKNWDSSSIPRIISSANAVDDTRIIPLMVGNWKVPQASAKTTDAVTSNGSTIHPPAKKKKKKSSISASRLCQGVRSSLSGKDLNSENELVDPPLPLDHRSAAHQVAKNIFSAVRNTSLDGWTLKELLFAFLALVGTVLSFCVIVYDAVFLMDFVAYFCMAFGGSAVFMQRTLTDLESFRKLNNEAREEVNKLRENNQLLEQQNDRLERFGEKLKDSEATLKEIGEKQGVSVNILIEQVEKYQKIQQDIRRSVTDQIRQTLISAVMDSDADHDYVISGVAELKIVCQRLNAIPMVQFNEEAFLDAMKKTDGSVLLFTRDYLGDDEALELEQIFVFLNE